MVRGESWGSYIRVLRKSGPQDHGEENKKDEKMRKKGSRSGRACASTSFYSLFFSFSQIESVGKAIKCGSEGWRIKEERRKEEF